MIVGDNIVSDRSDTVHQPSGRSEQCEGGKGERERGGFMP